MYILLRGSVAIYRIGDDMGKLPAPSDDSVRTSAEIRQSLGERIASLGVLSITVCGRLIAICFATNMPSLFLDNFEFGQF